MSLANVVAMSGCANNIVLLGDPQQLEQPIQGVHPDGAGASSLGHLLDESKTVPPNRGLFLERTWRLHPQITAFTSELFYEGKLESVPGLEQQRVLDEGLAPEFAQFAGSGLRWVPVEHDGNTNASVEEAERVCEIWNALVGRQWIDADGARRTISPDDIVIVSPFNAHRLLIQSMLPAARVGTVDKFQGQEAPVSIYTMATSRPEDAPRGLAFLYSLNRLNVATSRAKALAIVVAARRLLDVVPGSPDGLRMANGLCDFAEASSSSHRQDGDTAS
jgi:superfamily I DNA and/or RNA helicase